MFGLWAATTAFGYQMSAPVVILALATAMLFTRRTAPFAGAGVMVVALVPTLWYGAGVPFAIATLGVSAYRLLTVGLPLPASFAALPRLRALDRRGSGREAGTNQHEPALAP